MISYHSQIGNAAYIDLLRLLKDEAVTDLRGSVERRERNGRTYLYDRFRIGDVSRARYIGEATEALEARIARAQSIRQGAAERRRERARLVRLLRSEGYAGLDNRTGSLLTAMARVGVFRLGGTMVGTVAFRTYEGELGVRLGLDRMAQTGDIDIASFERLSLALGDEVTEPLETVLSELKFTARPSLDPGKVWRWADAQAGMEVEFLTAAFGDETLKPLPSMGVSAQALNYLNYVLAEPIHAAALYRDGILVQIPRPERFAIHKLIVADRRRDGTESLKARKDRAQAAFLIEALAEDRPDDLAEAWEDARARGPKWRERIDRTLDRMPATRAHLRGVT